MLPVLQRMIHVNAEILDSALKVRVTSRHFYETRKHYHLVKQDNVRFPREGILPLACSGMGPLRIVANL